MNVSTSNDFHPLLCYEQLLLLKCKKEYPGGKLIFPVFLKLNIYGFKIARINDYDRTCGMC